MPNTLHIPLLAYIPSPPFNGFSVGPFFFHIYGICYVLAAAQAILITRRRWSKRGGDPDLVYGVAWWGFPAGLVGGRIYFDITTPSQMPHHWWGPFAIWDGGMGIWGGVALGAAVGYWYLRKHVGHLQADRFVNVVTPTLLIGQAIGRIGNYFNQELYGKPSKLPWALEISPAHRVPGYAHYATFQPSFLYEMLFDLFWAGVLIWLDNHRKVRPPAIFPLYVAGYSGYRIFEETIRIDYSQYILGMRLNFWVAIIGTIAGLVWFALIQFRRRPGGPAEPPDHPTRAYSQSAQA
jgi:prolipoprotein diacylglyceryl transferase